MEAAKGKANNSAESEIRALIDDWSRAVANKDADAILEHYDEDVVAFDVPPPLQVKGREAFRKNIEDWLKMFDGSPQVEFKDQKIITSGDLAVLHQLARIGDSNKGADSDQWVRVTVCYQKNSGRWLVTHEHASLPFSMGGDGN
jgi:uncharacterized protein (TIGR02246 family)